MKTKDVPGDLRDAARVFPAVKDRLAEFVRERLVPVRELTVVETVLGGAFMQLGAHTKAECALILWHEASRDALTAVAVELSFRYGDKDEDYHGGRVERAYQVFRSLQTDLSAWVDPALPTKTAVVYGAAVDA